MRRSLSMLAYAILLLCANPDASSEAPAPDASRKAQDSIIIPSGAREVQQVPLFTDTDDSVLNEHMVILWSQLRPYLLLFDGCPALGRHDPEILIRYTSFRSLHPGDFVHVNQAACTIDRMYKITPADATALRKRFPRK